MSIFYILEYVTGNIPSDGYATVDFFKSFTNSTMPWFIN